MLLLKFILAFCSLSYELILAQALSAFLDNTVLRYSTTIGLYMLAMGLGALASSRIDTRRTAFVLWQAEILLVLTGALSVISLFVLSGFNAPVIIVLVWAYLLVALIGFLTGLELPLILIMAAKQGSPSRGGIIGIDYAGAFCATLVFVFYFYSLGLVPAGMTVVLLNALAAVFMVVRWQEDFAQNRDMALVASFILAGGILPLLLFSGVLESHLFALYIKQAY